MVSPIHRQLKAASAARLTFPDDESRQAWLPLLLEAYAIVDAGINEAIRREEAQGRTLACHKGCAACCRRARRTPSVLRCRWHCPADW